MSTPSEKPSPSSGSSSWRRRLRRLQTELGDFAVRNLINLGAVVAVGCWSPPTHPTVRAVGALAGVAALVAILVRRWSDFYPKPKTRSARLLRQRPAAAARRRRRGLPARPPGRRDGRGGRRLGRARDPAPAGDGRAAGQDPARAPPRSSSATCPGVPPVPKARFSPGWIAAGNVLAIVVAAVLAAVGAPGWTLLVPALATVPLTLLTVRHALRVDRGEQADRAGHPGRAAGVRAGLRRLLRRQPGRPLPARHVAAVPGAARQAVRGDHPQPGHGGRDRQH